MWTRTARNRVTFQQLLSQVSDANLRRVSERAVTANRLAHDETTGGGQRVALFAVKTRAVIHVVQRFGGTRVTEVVGAGKIVGLEFPNRLRLHVPQRELQVASEAARQGRNVQRRASRDARADRRYPRTSAGALRGPRRSVAGSSRGGRTRDSAAASGERIARKRMSTLNAGDSADVVRCVSRVAPTDLELMLVDVPVGLAPAAATGRIRFERQQTSAHRGGEDEARPHTYE